MNLETLSNWKSEAGSSWKSRSKDDTYLLDLIHLGGKGKKPAPNWKSGIDYYMSGNVEMQLAAQYIADALQDEGYDAQAGGKGYGRFSVLIFVTVEGERYPVLEIAPDRREYGGSYYRTGTFKTIYRYAVIKYSRGLGGISESGNLKWTLATDMNLKNILPKVYDKASEGLNSLYWYMRTSLEKKGVAELAQQTAEELTKELGWIVRVGKLDKPSTTSFKLLAQAPYLFGHKRPIKEVLNPLPNKHDYVKRQQTFQFTIICWVDRETGEVYCGAPKIEMPNWYTTHKDDRLDPKVVFSGLFDLSRQAKKDVNDSKKK